MVQRDGPLPLITDGVEGVIVLAVDLALPRGVWRFFLAIAAPLRHCCRLDGDAKLLGSGGAPLESGFAV